MAGDETALRLRGIARRFARRWVLRGIDVDAARGEVIALTGRNGSGKTTLLRVCATMLRPSRGGGRVFGHDLVLDAAAVREHVGLLGHAAGLYDDLTARENLAFAERMRGHRPEEAALARVLDEVGLTREAGERVRGFSAGMRRRLALARLLLAPPSLLLLDEPFAAFDTDGIARVNRFAAAVAAGGGLVLVATHDIGRGRDVFTRRLHLEDGLAGERSLDVEAAGVVDADGP